MHIQQCKDRTVSGHLGRNIFGASFDWKNKIALTYIPIANHQILSTASTIMSSNLSIKDVSATMEHRDLIKGQFFLLHLPAAATTSALSFVGADRGSERRKDFVLLFPDDLLQTWVLA